MVEEPTEKCLSSVSPSINLAGIFRGEKPPETWVQIHASWKQLPTFLARDRLLQNKHLWGNVSFRTETLKKKNTRLIVWCIAWAFSSFPSLFLFCLKSLQLWWILGCCDGISSVFPLFLDNTINSAPKVKSEGAINSQSGTKQSLRDTGPQRLALNSGDADKRYQPGVVFNVSSCACTKHTTPRSLC